jgi:hypothetical protein
VSGDVRILIVGAVGIGIFAWALLNAGPFGQLVSSSTQGYGNIVRALQPAQGVGYNSTGGNTGVGYTGGAVLG